MEYLKHARVRVGPKALYKKLAKSKVPVVHDLK